MVSNRAVSGSRIDLSKLRRQLRVQQCGLDGYCDQDLLQISFPEGHCPDPRRFKVRDQIGFALVLAVDVCCLTSQPKWSG